MDLFILLNAHLHFTMRQANLALEKWKKVKKAKSETNLGVKIVDNLLYIKFQAGLPSRLTSLFCINIEFLLF